MAKTIYIAYGSNLNFQQMKHRCPKAIKLEIAVLEDYQILFRGVKEEAYLTIEKFVGGQVPVLLWELDEADEKSLDVYEDFPILYRKEILNVKTENGYITAMAYIMNEGKSLAKPSQRYYTTVTQGYSDNNLNLSILNEALVKSTN